MATLKERMADIGKEGTIRIQAPKGITIEVHILDYKNSYGQDRWLVEPHAGEGQVWVEEVKIYE